MGQRYFPNQPEVNASSGTSLFVVLLVLAFAVLAVTLLVWWIKRHQESENYKRSLDLVMLKVALPKQATVSEEETRKDFRELITVAEPFFASLEHLYDHSKTLALRGQDHVTLEIAAHSRQIYFYVGVGRHLVSLVEKQIHSQYPTAFIEEVKDYSILRDQKAHIVGDQFRLSKNFALPIRTYKSLESNSLNPITNALSKMGDDATGVIQVLVMPTNGYWRGTVNYWSRQLQMGRGFNPHANTPLKQSLAIFFKSFSRSGLTTKDPESEAEKHRISPIQEEQLKLLNEKVSKTGFETQIRILVTATDKKVAEMHLNDIISAFSQFADPTGNSFKPMHYKNIARLVLDYILRTPTPGQRMLLNTEELASVYHFPNRLVETPNIHWLKAKVTAPPPNLPSEGRLLGVSKFRGETRQVFIKPADRLRHVYSIGKTGVGKSTLLQNMAVQDIQEGLGVAYLDPHGDSVEYILKRIPSARLDDVILFDPADTERPLALNLLEWQTPEQRDFLVQEAVQIFYKLFDPHQTGIVGPQFEHWLRNAALTLMSDPEGGTLIEIPRLFTDKEFEKQQLAHVTDPVVRAFWEQQMAKTSDFHKSEMLNYFTSKFGRFMTNTMMRNIIGQPKSAFDFRDVMDNGKILLVNLSKGKIGEVNSNLLGMILVSKLQMAAMSRADIAEEQRVPFYLYVDEFQNFTTDAFASILSEARKYRLALVIANQYIEQLTEAIRNAVIGNAGTLAAFRVGAADAEFLVHEFQPLVTDDLMNIEKYNFYLKLLIDNRAERPFNCETIPQDDTGSAEVGEMVRNLSRLKFGRDARVVDQLIRERSRVDQIALGPVEPALPAAR